MERQHNFQLKTESKDDQKPFEGQENPHADKAKRLQKHKSHIFDLIRDKKLSARKSFHGLLRQKLKLEEAETTEKCSSSGLKGAVNINCDTLDDDRGLKKRRKYTLQAAARSYQEQKMARLESEKERMQMIGSSAWGFDPMAGCDTREACALEIQARRRKRLHKTPNQPNAASKRVSDMVQSRQRTESH